jgi:hypothetical protein
MTVFRFLLVVSLLLSLAPLRAEAHNGAVAVAVPVSNITVDGDFSDWPDGLKRYAFTNPSFVAFGDEIDQGNFRVSRSSIQGSFRVGYSAIENALYVAVEIPDDSVFVVPAERGRDGNEQDGCELYVDIAHEERASLAAQGYIWGNDRGIMCQPEDWITASCFEVEVSRGDGIHRYEWRVDIGLMNEGQTQLQSGMALGFDLSVFDRDGDDLCTWTRWGRGAVKVQVTDHRGDLILAGEGAGTGHMQGKVSWQEDAPGVSHSRVRFEVKEISGSARWAGSETSSNNLLNLINEILDLSRVEAGRIEVNPAEVDLAQLAEECAASVESLIGEHVQFHRRFEAVPAVRTDGEIVRKVLMNLLGNAVKFTEEGSISLSVRPVEDRVELSVSDTGMGIPEEDLPFIFEEFRQVERQGSMEKEGTGLGLAISRKSVELLGGETSAESEVGKGTTFALKLGDCES